MAALSLVVCSDIHLQLKVDFAAAPQRVHFPPIPFPLLPSSAVGFSLSSPSFQGTPSLLEDQIRSFNGQGGLVILTNAEDNRHYERWALGVPSGKRVSVYNSGQTDSSPDSIHDAIQAARRHLSGLPAGHAPPDTVVVNASVAMRLLHPSTPLADRPPWAHVVLLCGRVAECSIAGEECGYIEGEGLHCTHGVPAGALKWGSPAEGALVWLGALRANGLEAFQGLNDCGKAVRSTYARWFTAVQRLLEQGTPVAYEVVSGEFFLGEPTLKRYLDFISTAPRVQPSPTPGLVIRKRSYARVGLMGNPSDGYYGKTLSCTVENFWSEATLSESTRLEFIPNPVSDPLAFTSLENVHAQCVKTGYAGGVRLMQATCKRFWEYCAENGIALHGRTFALSYDTNIPRQVGLAGSSCIVVAIFRCLLEFYGVSELFPLPLQPQFILNVEREELGIAAGLQDRVVQTYEGLVFMDFSEALLREKGHGEYTRLDAACLPPLWLAYEGNPSDSGKIHSTVKQRWLEHDPEVRAAMTTWAGYADSARAALEVGDVGGFGALMDKNFALRRAVFGDLALGKANLAMTSIARQHGAFAKLPGSGGAVVIYCPDEGNIPRLRADFEDNGYAFVKLRPYQPSTVAR